MNSLRHYLKYAVTSVILVLTPGFLLAQTSEATAERLDQLFAQLAAADESTAFRIEQQIGGIWSRSGSDAMDLLLEKGLAALEAGQAGLAVEHFSALVDHAPEFAEGYNRRAQAYFATGLIGLAMSDLAEVLAREPRHFGALSGLARALEGSGDAEKAREVVALIEVIHPHMQGLDAAIERLDLALEGQSL